MAESGSSNGSGGAPFQGHPLNSDYATKLQPGPSEAFGENKPATDDPAWQPARDPLKEGDPRARATIINREIPLSVLLLDWNPPTIRRALQSHAAGLFDQPSQLVDAIVGDSRVQASLASLSGGLFSCPIRFDVPKRFKHDKQAKRCRDAWREVWPTLGTEPVLSESMQWESCMGFSIGQLIWDTDDPKLWVPHMHPWHPRFTYYHWTFRRYVANTLDGQVAVEPGDAHWVLHTPHNPYRGWMRGAVRAIAPWWLARNYALRDWARYSERHGMPIVKAISPFGADAQMVAAYRAALATLGQESVVNLPQSPAEAVGKYDLELLEASDQAWQGFQQLIEQCNAEITLALQGQNLTSEVKEGSFAAARVHGDVKQAIVKAKARAWERTIYTQVTRAFAAINFGDAELAPRTVWDVDPYEDNELAAKTLLALGQALNALRQAGKKVKDVRKLAKSMGIELGELEDVVPLQVEAKAAGKTGKDDNEEDAPKSSDKEQALAQLRRGGRSRSKTRRAA